MATDQGQKKLNWSRSRAKVFRRRDARPETMDHPGHGHINPHDQEKGNSPEEQANRELSLPTHNEEGHRINAQGQRINEKGHRINAHGHRINHNGHRVTPGIEPDGESGRKWFNPVHFFKICFRSSSNVSKWTNILWPFTIAALVLYFNYPEHHVWIFATAYLGMVPAANLVGFAGQELARKIPKVMGVVLETTFGSIVEIILFVVLLRTGDGHIPVIRAAILGSILANLLLCLGFCFFVGGIFHPQQSFHEAISEVGSNLMLVAGFGLVIPTIYANSLSARFSTEAGAAVLDAQVLRISRAAAIILLVAFVVYVWFQTRSHHGLYEDILEADEERDHDRHMDLAKAKLTLTESIVAIVIALMFVSLMAVILVMEIEFIVEERGVPDAFLGLILIPLVEKASEHLTAIDEAYDNQMNFALSHVLGASIQTALLNTPLIVLVAWGYNMDLSLNFELFDAVVLIMAIIVVGNFLRDEKSDYLEGALCVFVYTLIAVTAFYYPNPEHPGGTVSTGAGDLSESFSAAHKRWVMPAAML